jgi:hypothetical protein
MASSLGSDLALLRSPNDILIDSQFRNNKTDPSMPPEHEPGDGWIVMGMLVGGGGWRRRGILLWPGHRRHQPLFRLCGGGGWAWSHRNACWRRYQEDDSPKATLQDIEI